jgi:tetratricopeptide (TPR) repeat protein
MDGSPRASVFAYQEELDLWRDRLLHEKEVTSRKPFFVSPKRFVIVLSVSIVLTFVLTFVAWKILSPKTGVLSSSGPFLPYPTDKPSLAVLYFQNNTGDPRLDHWSTGLSDLLIYKLSQSELLWILPKDRLLSIFNLTGLENARSYSTENLKKLAAQHIGRYLLSGSFFKSGERIQVHATIQDSRSGKVVGVISEECQGEAGLMGLVDNLSPRIKTTLDLSEAKIAADLDRSLGEITTSSPEALRLFSEGTGFYMRGNAGKAIELLEKAVEIDPDFALAHRQLAALYHNQGQREKSGGHIQKALALKDRVSERERLIIEGQGFMHRGEYEKAVDAATRLLERWPEDILGNRYLQQAFWRLGDYESSLKYAERGFRLYPESSIECINLCNSYWMRGEIKKPEEILLAYNKRIPDSADVHGFLGWHFCLINKFDRALQEVETYQRLSPRPFFDSRAKGMTYFAKGDLEAYSRLADELLDSQNPRERLRARDMRNWMRWMQGKHTEAKNSWKEIMSWEPGEEWAELARVNLAYVHRNLAALSLGTGEFESALEESSEALRLAVEQKDMADQRWVLVCKGEALLGLKNIDGARKTADELLLTLKDEKDKSQITFHYLLDGLIELESGNPKNAVEKLKRGASLLQWRYGAAWIIPVLNNNAYYFDALGQAYFRAGKLASAKAEYEKIISTGLFRYAPDIWVKSFYWLGRIAQDRGKKAQAREHYQRFLDLWKDADPLISEVEDAKLRLKALTD